MYTLVKQGQEGEVVDGFRIVTTNIDTDNSNPELCMLGVMGTNNTFIYQEGVFFFDVVQGGNGYYRYAYHGTWATDGVLGWHKEYSLDKHQVVKEISGTSTDDEVPSAKCIYDLIGNIETLLQGV